MRIAALMLAVVMLGGCAYKPPNFHLESSTTTFKVDYDNFTGEHEYHEETAADGSKKRDYKIMKKSVVDWSDLVVAGVVAVLTAL